MKTSRFCQRQIGKNGIEIPLERTVPRFSVNIGEGEQPNKIHQKIDFYEFCFSRV
jgi:hypothetical protein